MSKFSGLELLVVTFVSDCVAVFCARGGGVFLKAEAPMVFIAVCFGFCCAVHLA